MARDLAQTHSGGKTRITDARHPAAGELLRAATIKSDHLPGRGRQGVAANMRPNQLSAEHAACIL